MRLSGLMVALAAWAGLQTPLELPGLAAVTPLPSPASGRSGMPQLTPHELGVVLSWLSLDGDTATLWFAERTDTGWTAPRKVAAGGDWFVNWADVPSVIRLDESRLAAHWLQKSGPGTYAYDVRLSFSRDAGATWSASATPHHDGTETEHGFASLYRDNGGGLGLIWLDGRAMKPGSHGHDGGGMTVRSARFDRDGRQVDERLVDDRVCECCPTSAAMTGDGPIVLYRDRAAGEVRDIYASKLGADGWSTPSPVFADRWVFPACPVNGPAVSASGRSVAAAWFTVKEGAGHAYVSFSGDSGRSFSAPVRVDDQSSLGRVDVELLGGGRAVAAWLEVVDHRAEWRLRLVDADGRRGPSTTVARVTSSRSSGYPRMARRGRELVLAWTEPEGGATRVATAVVAVP